MKHSFLIILIWLFFFCLRTATPNYVKIKIGQTEISAEVVKTQADQSQGLGYRDRLENGKGMLFVYKKSGTRTFWMKGMRFAIDIIWIRHGKIVLIEKSVQPESILKKEPNLKTYGHSVSADMVLEVTAGLSEKMKFELGQQVVIDE